MDFSLRGIALAQGYPQRHIQALADRQQDILKIKMVLNGTYRYDSIDAAVNASGVRPDDIYMSLSSGENTLALARFYEALTGREIKI